MLCRADVERLLTPRLCIAAVEDAMRRLAEGQVPAPGILGMHAGEGSFHVKSSFLTLERPYFAAKLNANFPNNGARHGLPTIQGAVVLSDAADGTLLAVMDSIGITALRTAAASAVAVKFLAREVCDTALIVGCGGQARAQLQALLCMREPRRVLAYDQDGKRALAFAAAMPSVEAVPDLDAAAAQSDLIITCTTARKFILRRDAVRPGTFIAAVGADSEKKQEIEPALMAAAKVVTDLTDQACNIGDLHHAIAEGAMTREDVHAELAEIVAGKKPGRETASEITLFDSTGTGLQDVAAAIAVYEEAVRARVGTSFQFSERMAA
jgi:alanine dehydrogenase